jgi:hypothetical protein
VTLITTVTGHMATLKFLYQGLRVRRAVERIYNKQTQPVAYLHIVDRYYILHEPSTWHYTSINHFSREISRLLQMIANLQVQKTKKVRLYVSPWRCVDEISKS